MAGLMVGLMAVTLVVKMDRNTVVVMAVVKAEWKDVYWVV